MVQWSPFPDNHVGKTNQKRTLDITEKQNTLQYDDGGLHKSYLGTRS